MQGQQMLITGDEPSRACFDRTFEDTVVIRINTIGYFAGRSNAAT